MKPKPVIPALSKAHCLVLFVLATHLVILPAYADMIDEEVVVTATMVSSSMSVNARISRRAGLMVLFMFTGPDR